MKIAVGLVFLIFYLGFVLLPSTAPSIREWILFAWMIFVSVGFLAVGSETWKLRLR